MEEHKINWKLLIPSVAIPLLVGGAAGILTSPMMEKFGEVPQPPLAPPGWLFPVAWTVLYTAMGVASYRVLRSEKPQREKEKAIKLYGLQLFLNFLWPLLFFGFGLYGFSFFWLLALLAAVILTAVRLYRIDKAAGWLLVPYILWLCFAAYLNAGVAILN